MTVSNLSSVEDICSSDLEIRSANREPICDEIQLNDESHVLESSLQLDTSDLERDFGAPGCILDESVDAPKVAT